MIHIKELFRLQDIQHLRLIAGRDGLERTVTAAVLFEYDPSRVQLPDFYRGDLVVTTLAYARGDAQLVAHSLQALMNQGIASLMVKTAYFSELPQSVIALANRLGTPVFLFDDTYIEEVILQVTDLIRGKRHFSGFEQDVDALMRGDLTEEQTRERARRIDPVTDMTLEEDAYFEMDTLQIGGVTSTNRTTNGRLGARAKLVIRERLMTDGDEIAASSFNVSLDGDDSGVDLVSRSVARGMSYQEYRSVIKGNCRCTGHSECDAILVDQGRVKAEPALYAGHLDASLIHEAAIGKIAGEQIIKLRTLGLTEEEAERKIISGFLSAEGVE